MLVLSRKKDETIRIGQEVTIRIIRTSSGSVRIGVDAPRHMNVYRGELCSDTSAGDEDKGLERRKSSDRLAG